MIGLMRKWPGGWRVAAILMLALMPLRGAVAEAETEVEADTDLEPTLAVMYGSYTGERDAELAVHYLHVLLEGYEIPYHDAGHWLEPEEFENYDVVLICHLRGSESRPWTDEQIEQVKAYVEQGGHLVMLSDAVWRVAGEGRRLDRISGLIGARHRGRGEADARVMAEDHPVTRHLVGEAHDWITSTGSGAITRLEGARVLVGTEEAGWVIEHELGEGRVFVLGHEPFRLEGQSVSEGESFGLTVAAALREGDPARRLRELEVWTPEPLGPDVEPSFEPPPQRQQLERTLQKRSATGEPVVPVTDGEASSVIVIGDESTRAAVRAADALQRGFKLASGAEVPIVRESEVSLTREGDRVIAALDDDTDDAPQYVILVGEGEFVRAEYDVQQDELDYEQYVLRTEGNALIVAGRDLRDGGRPTMGTRHGAYALLERHLGFRWLWPGELGEVVPEHATIEIGPVHETDAPAIRFRRIRNQGAGSPRERNGERVHRRSDYQQGLDRLRLDLDDMLAWHADAGPWFGRQRLGRSVRMSWGHTYGGWYERFGEDHPEWFALQPARQRGREQWPPRERLCVSNRELAEQVAQEKIEELHSRPDWQAVPISPNDGTARQTFCMCEDCRKLDPPNAPTVGVRQTIGRVRRQVEYPSLTDRYLTFYSRVAEKVAEEHPDRWVAGYAYSLYRHPPLYAEAHPNLLVGYVGLSYFNDATLERHRDNWDRWAAAAHQIMLRPNAFHAGHGVPAVFVDRLGRDIRHGYETGMVAADFDSAIHHWGTQGVNYYVLARMLWDPSLDPQEIVDDYVDKGFGSAAEHVRAYFHDLEALNADMAADRREQELEDGLEDIEVDYLPVRGGFETNYFTPERTEPLREHLARARDAASGDELIQERIAFLEIGLDYAQMQAAVRDPALEDDPERGRELMARRQELAHRIFHEYPFAVNVVYLTGRREGSFYRRYDFDPDNP